jgi:HAD superfamily hydrolase (TIGR01509 family)
MALSGFVFDLDGTIVDSNALHVEAFRRAFAARGYKVGGDRIFVEVGKGGDKLVPAIIGEELDRVDGDAIRDAHPREYAKLVGERGLRVLPGARELAAELRRRGLRTVLATSSGEGHLKATEQGSGLKLREMFDEVVGADDAEQSKPAPDVVAASVKMLGVSPAECAMLGDTPYDAWSARDAGVICFGLTCGGHDEKTLRGSGCRAVWRDPAEVLAKLDEALRMASPGSVRLTHSRLDALMREALTSAREGMEAGEAPIGCVLARSDGSVIARAYNELNRTGVKTAHAEMAAFARSAGKVPPEARDLLLVSTLEPCVMCLGASMEAAVDTIVYGLRAPADSGTGRVEPPQSPESQMPRIVGGVLAREGRDLFEQWLRKPGNNPQQVAFVRQLLALTERSDR